jgi:4-hydroxy-3-polyprenylbenzoate decarboxylase
VHEVHAVDAAGVHPLLLAIGSERYTPYYKEKKPQEILTIANHILGTGQMSLAKYLFIIDKNDNPQISTYKIHDYFKHLLERVDWSNDLHFYTKTTIDTLDYSGSSLNNGSKVVIAAAGEKKRELSTSISSDFNVSTLINKADVALPGILILQADKYSNESAEKLKIKELSNYLEKHDLKGFPIIVLADDSAFTAKTLNNFLWVTFTRSNPSHDIYGIGEFYENKHWGCKGSLIIDARIKPHHAPALEKVPEIEKRVDALGAKGKSLYGII